MPWSVAIQGHWRAITLGALALTLAVFALKPQWLVKTARAVFDGFFELFLAGWMC